MGFANLGSHVFILFHNVLKLKFRVNVACKPGMYLISTLTILNSLKTEATVVRRMGFNCKTAIQPKQLSIIHSAWQANEQELQWARSIVNQYDERVRNKDQDIGAFLHEGRLIDEPIIRRARQLVAQAQALPPDSNSVNSTDTAALGMQTPSS